MTALEDFERYLIDEERFSPVTVHHTIQKLSYIFDHTKESTSRDSIQSFIREVWGEKGNGTANQYIKVANRWLKFKKEEPLKYFKAYGNSFTVRLESSHLTVRTSSTSGQQRQAKGCRIRISENYARIYL